MNIFDEFTPRQPFESDLSLCKRALDHLMSKGVTSKQDMYAVISKRFSISKATLYKARKDLVNDYLEKYRILSKETDSEKAKRLKKEKTVMIEVRDPIKIE